MPRKPTARARGVWEKEQGNGDWRIRFRAEGKLKHVNYVPQTGRIWFACICGGFYVIELKPELRPILDCRSCSPRAHGRRCLVRLLDGRSLEVALAI